MDAEAREGFEAEIRRKCEAGQVDSAATEAIRAYGPEIFGFLVALHRDEGDASDVFSTFSENLWKGLPKFSWQCTLRAWAYTVARNASHRFRRNARRHVQGRVPLSAHSALDGVAEKVRTQTLEYLKTEQKDKFAALRETLPAEDQMLLILRVDRRLAWEELARVTLSERDGEPGDPDEAEIAKESARLRKRFQLVKDKLRTMGERAGLIARKED